MGNGPKPVKVHEKAVHEKARHGIATIPTGCLFIGPHLLLTASSWGTDSGPPVFHQRHSRSFNQKRKTLQDCSFWVGFLIGYGKKFEFQLNLKISWNTLYHLYLNHEWSILVLPRRLNVLMRSQMPFKLTLAVLFMAERTVSMCNINVILMLWGKKRYQMQRFHADSWWTVRVEAELNLVDKNHSTVLGWTSWSIRRRLGRHRMKRWWSLLMTRATVPPVVWLAVSYLGQSFILFLQLCKRRLFCHTFSNTMNNILVMKK